MELMPQDQIEFDRIKSIIEDSYKKYGFLPIDTPIIEDSNVLLAKAGGETEKQIYRFSKGDNDLSLRFDLTVPLAKYVAKNYGQLSFPFRRYQIGKVYRAERPQKGRYREFYQCDIDVIGDETLSITNDAEMPSIIYQIFSKLDFGKFTIRINNRKLLGGFFESLGLENRIEDILKIVDKLDKIGIDNVKEMLQDEKVDSDSIEKIVQFVSTKENVIQFLESLNISNDTFVKGLSEIKEVSKYMIAFGVPENYFRIDLSIARGLDYYTGTVFETTLDDLPNIGSVCSGGRYDNLAEYYTDKKLPGVGISIGLTRLYYILNEYNLIKNDSLSKSVSKAIILPMSQDFEYSIKVATLLRNMGINAEVYFEDKAFKKKLNYANKQNIPYAIIIGDDEINSETVAIKNMQTGEQQNIKLSDMTIDLFK
jgi:histidyl-tRNA synthetase